MVPFTIGSFWFRYLPIHNWWGTLWILGILMLALWIGITFYRRMAAVLGDADAAAVARDSGPEILALTCAVCLTLAVSFGALEGRDRWAPFGFEMHADLPAFEFSGKPAAWSGLAEGDTERLSKEEKKQAKIELAEVAAAALDGTNLRFANAPGAFLVRAELRAANLERARLTNANLEDANLEGAGLAGADLRAARLRSADLHGANLADADLTGADLTRAELSRAVFRGANLQNADLRGARFYEADLRGADLGFAILEDASFSRTDLRGVNFANADLRDARMPEADLRGATFHLDRRRAGFQGAILSGANLQGLDLAGFPFAGASLSEADLRDTDLSGADLSRTRLENADLRGANLEGALLTEAALGGADLTGARVSWNMAEGEKDPGLTREQFSQTCGRPASRLPRGWKNETCPERPD